MLQLPAITNNTNIHPLNKGPTWRIKMTIAKIFFTILVVHIIIFGYFKNAHSDSFLSESDIKSLKGFKFDLQRIDSRAFSEKTETTNVSGHAKGDSFLSESDIKNLKEFKFDLQHIDSKAFSEKTGGTNEYLHIKGDSFFSKFNIKALEGFDFLSKCKWVKEWIQE